VSFLHTPVAYNCPVSARTILHVDLDAFYATVEQRDDPTLRGRPVIVGWPSKRGVVCAASYEARPFGVRSAMPMARAMQLCPQAAFIAPRMGHYSSVSAEFFKILHDYSPLVEGLSLDEAFLDATGEERLFGDGPAIGRTIKGRVRAELGLVASVGVAPVKFVAKIASDLGKPDGLLVVPDGGVIEFLHPLPVSRLWGVGETTERHLAELSLRTIGDVARVGERVIAGRLGRETSRHLAALARGEDPRDVVPERAPVSVGHEDTFDGDLRDREALVDHLLDQADRTCARLRDLGLRARVVTIKVKYANHDLVTRRITLPRSTTDGRLVGRTARELLAHVPDVETRGVRLTGVSLSGLAARDGGGQLALPVAEEREAARGEQLGDALDKIAGKFGDRAIRRAVHLHEGPREVVWPRPPKPPKP
jgi:DNA polymerase IV